MNDRNMVLGGSPGSILRATWDSSWLIKVLPHCQSPVWSVVSQSTPWRWALGLCDDGSDSTGLSEEEEESTVGTLANGAPSESRRPSSMSGEASSPLGHFLRCLSSRSLLAYELPQAQA